MFTRNLNERIFFIEYKNEKNQNGDLIKKEKERFFCWAEVAKATTKEFRDRSTDKIEELKKDATSEPFIFDFAKTSKRKSISTGVVACIESSISKRIGNRKTC